MPIYSLPPPLPPARWPRMLMVLLAGVIVLAIGMGFIELSGRTAPKLEITPECVVPRRG